ncbi:unnamed protein product [Nezara viridula]|uniref:Uncharacterized protein n=1 Tax=Nezara viridula TaxID=85310 RepID=A0A9P0E3T7_NEZVI|nr:unnamed protein product [Nezara viridula]
MFPFRLVDGWELRMSRKALFHSFVVAVFSIFSFYKSTMSSKKRLYNFIFLTELFSLNLTVHGHLSDALFTVLSVQRRHGIRLRCRSYLTQLLMCSLCLLIILIYRLFELNNRSWTNILFTIAYFLPTWMMFSSIMVFSSVCLLIGDSFVSISAALLNPYRGLAELDFLLQTHFVLITAAESMTGAATSYLLILFQFSDSD